MKFWGDDIFFLRDLGLTTTMKSLREIHSLNGNFSNEIYYTRADSFPNWEQARSKRVLMISEILNQLGKSTNKGERYFGQVRDFIYNYNSTKLNSKLLNSSFYITTCSEKRETMSYYGLSIFSLNWKNYCVLQSTFSMYIPTPLFLSLRL